MVKRSVVFTFSLSAVISLGACTPEQTAVRVDAERGEQLYFANCAVCHGADARGAGPASLGLGAPPPSLLDLSKKNGGVFPRDYVLSTIDGLERHDNPTAAMPEFGEGDMGQTIIVEEGNLGIPIPADLLALSTYLESIQK